MNIQMPSGIGAIIAIIVVAVGVVLLVVDEPLDREVLLGMLIALGLARLT